MSAIPPAVLGIDFGTSNSTAALARPLPASNSNAIGQNNTGASMVPLEGDSTSIPTCLFFNLEAEAGQSAVHFGRDAAALYREGYDGRLLRALKSILGSSLAQEGTVIGYKSYRLLDVLKIFIHHLKAKAELAAGHDIGTVVMGRPVFFVDDDKAADQQAEDQLRSVVADAGFKHISFQYEPVAAALSYEATLNREELVLIADLGGGTADFTLIRLSPERHHQSDRTADLLANDGIHIGGTDLDRLLAFKGLMPLLGLGSKYSHKDIEMPISPFLNLSTWHRINMMYTPRAQNEITALLREAAEPKLIARLQKVVENRKGHALLNCVEGAKISLTDTDETVADCSIALDKLKVRFTRKQFDKAIAKPAADIRSKVEEILKKGGCRPEQVQTIFFTGGTSVVPLIRQEICAALPQASVINGDPVAAVGHGLALDAVRRL